VGDRVGAGQVQKQVVEGNDPHRGHGLVYEGELPKRKHTTFRTRRTFEIKKDKVVHVKVIKARMGNTGIALPSP
jgi:hypothetical protein